MTQFITDCHIDPERLTALSECMQCCGPDEPTDDWNHSLIHPDTVAYSCGRLSFDGHPSEHNHDPEELALCLRLAAEATQAIGQTKLFFSESFDSIFHPFFIVANHAEPSSNTITSELIRLMFGGAIYPQAEVIIEPFSTIEPFGAVEPFAIGPFHGNSCWEHFVNKHETWEGYKAHLEGWQHLFDWFESQDELNDACFVMIGIDESPSETNFGCGFPRLVLGITGKGSLVGVCSHAVHT